MEISLQSTRYLTLSHPPEPIPADAGAVPTDLAHLHNLEFLDISGNDLGEVILPVPSA